MTDPTLDHWVIHRRCADVLSRLLKARLRIEDAEMPRLTEITAALTECEKALKQRVHDARD